MADNAGNAEVVQSNTAQSNKAPKFRWYLVDGNFEITGTNDPAVAQAAADDDGYPALIDTEHNVDASVDMEIMEQQNFKF